MGRIPREETGPDRTPRERLSSRGAGLFLGKDCSGCPNQSGQGACSEPPIQDRGGACRGRPCGGSDMRLPWFPLGAPFSLGWAHTCHCPQAAGQRTVLSLPGSASHLRGAWYLGPSEPHTLPTLRPGAWLEPESPGLAFLPPPRTPQVLQIYSRPIPPVSLLA